MGLKKEELCKQCENVVDRIVYNNGAVSQDLTFWHYQPAPNAKRFSSLTLVTLVDKRGSH